MKQIPASILIKSAASSIALLLLVIHIWRPELNIDSIALGLIVISILPWIAALIESAKFPGGWEVTFREMKKAEADLKVEAESIRVLAEHVAELGVTLGTDGIQQLMPSHLLRERFDRERERLRTRDRILAILRLAGGSSSKIEEVNVKFDTTVKAKLKDLLSSWLTTFVSNCIGEREQAWQKELEAIRKSGAKDAEAQYKQKLSDFHAFLDNNRYLHEYASREKIIDEINASNCNAEHLAEYLRTEGIWDDDIEQLLSDFDAFLEEHGIQF